MLMNMLLIFLTTLVSKGNLLKVCIHYLVRQFLNYVWCISSHLVKYH
ncbi:hypothetical protein GLYMA_19G126750v4 [Glycine max]|nr:hypothetical protein GLYMA_19G126750v4 [Glycine max]KAH1077558.1 hypothetical protein GYH30_052879 [Glycine max]